MSIPEQTLEALNALRLSGMHSEYTRVLNNPALQKEGADVVFARMCQAEQEFRDKKRLDRNFKLARLRIPGACIENVDFVASRGLARDQITSLAHCDWIDRSQNVIFTGCAGTGKTHLACALANQAIRHGYTVLYKRLTQLLEELDLAQGSGTLAKVRNAIAKVNLLVLDDWGISAISVKSRLNLLDVIEQRANQGSLLITAQMPISGWYDYIADPTIADAILDRVVHRAHKIELRGESMRKLKESV